MKSNVFSWMARIIAVLALLVAAGAQAQAPMPEHFSGIISDYTPSIPSTKPNTPPTPPYEMRGHWSLHLNRRTGNADFTAIIAMEFSDYWLLTTPGVDPTNSALRGQHTHHITMTEAVPSDTSTCPTYSPATTNLGLAFTGMADITGNGSAATFQQKSGQLSALQVCINGGSEVEFSNISLVFQTGAPAIAHFGSQAIHGVVRFPHKSDEGDRDNRDWDRR